VLVLVIGGETFATGSSDVVAVLTLAEHIVASRVDFGTSVRGRGNYYGVGHLNHDNGLKTVATSHPQYQAAANSAEWMQSYRSHPHQEPAPSATIACQPPVPQLLLRTK
jgi:hypothetical protein